MAPRSSGNDTPLERGAAAKKENPSSGSSGRERVEAMHAWICPECGKQLELSETSWSCLHKLLPEEGERIKVVPQAHADDLAERLERAEEALKWYATNYSLNAGSPLFSDRGERARTALSAPPTSEEHP